MTSENPYQPPTEDRTAQQWSATITPFSALRTLTLWTVICGVSAIPSFLAGLRFADHPNKIVAMLLGIFLFAVGYTLFDLLYLREKVNKNPALRLTLFTGYIARMVASAVFPIGMMLDIWPGFISVMVVEGISGVAGEADFDKLALNSSVKICLTTIVQGMLLNAILFAFMLIVYCVYGLFGVPKHRRMPVSAVVVTAEPPSE